MEKLPEFHPVDGRDSAHGFQPDLLFPRGLDVLVKFVVESGQRRYVVLG